MAREPGKPTKKQDVKWFWDKIARKQSAAVLRQLEIQDLPSGVDPQQVLDACLKDYGSGRPHPTTVDEKMLLRYLGDGKLPDGGIAKVLSFGSAYTVLRLHKKRPDLMPAEAVFPLIEAEALELIRQHFVAGRRNDKQLNAFIRQIERIPGFAEIVAVHHVHGF